MHCLQIFLIFCLLSLTFSLHVKNLYSKSYKEISQLRNKLIHKQDIIKNQHSLWPYTYRTENNFNRKLYDLIAYQNRKRKASQNRLHKKNNLIHTDDIQPNIDTNRNLFGHENLQKPSSSIQSNQQRHIRKLDQGSQLYQNSIQAKISGNLSCTIPKWVNQKEIGKSLPIFYFNPCQPDTGRHCEFIYKNFILKKKFIQCDKSGKALVKSCPKNSKWDKNLQKCSYSYISSNDLCQTPSWVNPDEIGTKLPPYIINHCEPDDKRKCDFVYIEFLEDEKKFIQCDRLGNALIKSCPSSFEWDTQDKQCSLKTTMILTTTEQTPMITTEQVTETTEQTPMITTEQVTETTGLPCIIPSWDDQTDNGSELPSYYLKPCKPQPTRHCEFTYWGFEIDDSKFIQCDRSGNARLKSCPTSFKWDNNTNQCSPEVFTTTEQPCIIPSWVNETDNGSELPSYYLKPCKPQPTRHCEFTYWGFEIDDSKFIQCDRSGNARLMSCPTSFKWDNNTNQCSPEVITTTEQPCIIPSWVNETDNGSELPSYYLKPCKPQPTRHCEFTYWGFEIDDSKFIQCDRSGNARLKSCPTSFKWDNNTGQCSPEVIPTTEQPCIIPSWVNETDNGSELPSYYLKPCKPQPTRHCEFTYWGFEIDDSKFIQCDRSGNARLKSCPTSFKWDNNTGQCSPEVIPTTEQPCIIPSWVNETDNGSELPSYYLKPCKPQPTRHCEFTYWGFEIDDSKFIQCDRSGNARLMSCPTSFKWDNNTGQCSLEVIPTTEQPCIIPSWVNETDNGSELPSYYLKPCKPQPTRHCEFTYWGFEIDDSKFIQCDRSGNARLKSCPTSFKWDNNTGQCSPEVIPTTEQPCIIPSWVNETDNGSELPSYYLKPCKPQPTRHCEFTYWGFEIDDSKFIQCDRSGNARLKSCPTSFKWDNNADQCSPEVITTTELPCSIPSGVIQNEKVSPLPSFYPNPCTKDLSRVCEFSFKPFVIDSHKFIQCDKFGKASVKSCKPFFKWFQTELQCLQQIVTTSNPQCEIPPWVNQNEEGFHLPLHYPNPCTVDSNRVCLFIYKPFLLDQHKFILCDKGGNAVIKTCPPNFKWIDQMKKCSLENVQSTTKPQCEVPTGVDEKEKGIPLKPFYPNPCPVDSFRNCEFIYFIYILDHHKYIQCDRSGNAVIKSCLPNGIWNNHIKQCTIQNIMTTPRAACTVPTWMNPNEKGLPLSSFLPNPCKSTPIQTCKYFTYVLNDHKFIECDQYGKAWVKTCPSVLKWDSTLMKCTNVNIG